jgi:hypothetical protein
LSAPQVASRAVAAENDLAELVCQGVAVMFATRDGQLHPELARAWGPALSEDGERLTLCVEAPPESAMARTLQPGRPAAATLARLAARTTAQLKGPIAEVVEPTQDRLRAVAAHVDRFVAETAAVGVPEETARTLAGSELLTVTIEVNERL